MFLQRVNNMNYTLGILLCFIGGAIAGYFGGWMGVVVMIIAGCGIIVFYDRM